MNTLDLHGIKHSEVKSTVDGFIRKNLTHLPVEIITGNSLEMQNLVRQVINLYRLKMEPKNYVNLGSFIVRNK